MIETGEAPSLKPEGVGSRGLSEEPIPTELLVMNTTLLVHNTSKDMPGHVRYMVLLLDTFTGCAI